MKLIIEVSKLIFLWIFVTIILIFVVLLPRGIPELDMNQTRVEITAQYEENITTFSWEAYKLNIFRTYDYILENKSLGKTVQQLSAEYEVWRYFKKSLVILLPSMLICMALGVLKGVFDFSSTRKKYRIFGSTTTSLFLSIPDFFFIFLTQFVLMVLFAKGLPYVDLYGSETWSNKILAICFLSMYPLFYIASITSTFLEQQAGQDYVRTALSKGISMKRIIWKHLMSNCWIKIVSHINTIVLYLLSNLFIVEFLTGYRGGAYRFYKAFNIKRIFSPLDTMDIETGVIIGFIIVFTFIVLVSQIVSKIFIQYLIRKEGNSYEI